MRTLDIHLLRFLISMLVFICVGSVVIISLLILGATVYYLTYYRSSLTSAVKPPAQLVLQSKEVQTNQVQGTVTDNPNDWQNLLDELGVIINSSSSRSSSESNKSSKDIDQSLVNLSALRKALANLSHRDKPTTLNQQAKVHDATIDKDHNNSKITSDGKLPQVGPEDKNNDKKTLTDVAKKPNNTNDDELVILLWPFRNETITHSVVPCAKCANPKSRCLFTNKKEYLKDAHAIVFIISSIKFDMMPPRDPRQKWIFFSKEAPHHVKGSGIDLHVVDLMYQFNATCTYASDSDIYNGYGYCKRKSTPRNQSDFTSVAAQVASVRQNKTKMAAWFVHNCAPESNRHLIVNQLNKFITVDKYGGCGQLKCPREKECMDMLKRDYLFYLSFENALCNDYITEKAYKILSKDLAVIPIVYGGANYSRHLAPGSYINVADFESIEALARYMIYLSTNVTAFSEYFRWKLSYDCTWDINWGDPTCNYLHANRGRQTIVNSVESLFSHESQCYYPTPFS